MLLDSLPFAMPAHLLHLLFGTLVGLIFGAAAQITRFCLRRAVASEGGIDRDAAAVWLMALTVAVAGFAVARAVGWVDLGGHRLLAPQLPIVAIVIGGLAFGAGMVLTRGCVSRLTVLGAGGNLRALTVIVVFAITAHATLKGVLAPMRTALGSVQIDLGLASLSEVPAIPPALIIILSLGSVALARHAGSRPRDMILGAVIGAVAVIGWIGTSFALLDDFDPMPVLSLAFTLPWSDSLFWTIAATAIPAGFGVGLIGGVMLGAFASAALRGEVHLQGFDTPRQTLRYVGGGVLMGLGGVLAGGCTLGAGLSGSASLSIAALLALLSIIAGAVATRRAVMRGQGAFQPV